MLHSSVAAGNSSHNGPDLKDLCGSARGLGTSSHRARVVCWFQFSRKDGILNLTLGKNVKEPDSSPSNDVVSFKVIMPEV